MKLLLVDDEILSVERMKNCLDWESMNVDEIHTASHVEEARKIIEKMQIDVIISDIEMPGENGLDLMEWLEQKDNRMIRILLTCHQNFNYVVTAMRCGVFSYLLKPLDEKELARTIELAKKELARRDAANR